MKKFHLLAIGLLSMATVSAQDLTNALRYSQGNIEGTARFRALSGAFGALGGDMSAVSINPASSAVFSQSHASISFSNNEFDNNTTYFDGNGITNDSNLNLNQAGVAFVFKSTSNSPWRKFSLGVAFDRTNNLDDNWFAQGTGNTSIDRYFLDITEATNVPFGTLKLRSGEFLEEAYGSIGEIPDVGFDFQQVFLGYWGGVIDPENTDDTSNDDNVNYVSILDGSPYNQTYNLISNGYNGKIAFNLATQYKDNLYLGINLNSHFIDYERSTLFNENNDVSFRNNLSTTGSGFSFQLGGILKLSDEFRVGATYDSPTWYTIEEESSQGINSIEADDDIEFISNVINIHPRYRLQTPGKITGSLAYVFGKQGLVSFDYSRKDYSVTKLTPESENLDLNNAISDLFTSASTYKFGAEYKYEQFSFRGGYRFEESPYKDGVTVGDLNGFSLGLGYNFGNTKLDVTFDQWKRTDQTPLYNIGLIDAASIDRKNSNITLSLSFNI